jgi:hypothetical protein
VAANNIKSITDAVKHGAMHTVQHADNIKMVANAVNFHCLLVGHQMRTKLPVVKEGKTSLDC